MAVKSDPFRRVHSTDAVERSMLPGSNISGATRWPVETWNSHSDVGRYHRRPDTESSRPKSKSHRFSSGSRPLNTDPSRTHGPWSTPAVTTPNAICVESKLWWLNGA